MEIMTTITQLLCNRFGGIRERNSSFSEDLISAQDIQNVELYYTGINGGIGIRTTKGNVSFNDELLDTQKIINIFESTQNQTKYFFVYAEDELKGTFYNLNLKTNSLEILKDDLTVTGKSNGFDVAQGWTDLFFFTNGAEMFTVEMDILEENNVITDMTLIDRDGRTVVGIIAGIFNNRLWIASGNVIWYSVTSDIYDFSTANSDWVTSAGYIELIKNITAIHEYLGALAVFFADSSVLISVSNGDFSIAEESPGGCAGYNSLVFHDTNLYFYDDTKKAVFSFKQVISGEKTLGENVAVDIQDILLSIDSNNLDKIQALSVFMESRNEIWWIIPTKENDYSTIIIFDYLKGEWIKRKSQKINAVRIFDGKLYSAGDNGKILEEYNSDRFDGEYIQHYYNCSPLNLGAVNTLKVLAFPPRVSFDMPFNNQFYVKYIKNFNTFKKPKIKFIKSKLKNYGYWGKSLWGRCFWASKHTSSIGKFPTANFKVLEMSIYSQEASHNFAIKNIEFSKIKVKQV
jgi:hypothetical protein